MMLSRKQKELERQERRARRVEREDAAGKLRQKAPDLESLSISIHETRREGTPSDTFHIRRIVLDHAPALFDVACSDPACVDGGYDLTREILTGLASRQTTFEGEQNCGGQCGPIECGRRLKYVATATYREPQAPPASRKSGK